MPLDAPTAFFSYSRNDSEFTLRLAGDLKAAGAHVWLDQSVIEPGQRWARADQDALNNSSRVLVILSPSSVNSTNVEDEITFALEERKTVIPVLYRDCKIPFQLRPFQYVDFRTDYARGLKVMLRTLGVELQAAATPAAPSAASTESPPAAPDMDDSEIAKNQVPLEQQAAEPAWVGREHRQATEQTHLQEENRRAAEQTRLEQERKQAETRLALERQEAAEHDAKPQAQIERERLADDGAELEREVVAGPLVEPASEQVLEHDQTNPNPAFQKSRLKTWLLFVLFGAVLTTSLWYSARHPSITKGGSAEEHYDQGYRFWEKGDLTRAVLEYREAIRLAPNDFYEHSNLAVILGEKGDVDGAIAEYREAIRLMPDNLYGAMHHFNLGNMLRKKGDTEGAIIEYRKAITLSPDDAYSHDNLGVMLAEKGDIEGAIAEFREASRLNSNQDYNLKIALQYKNGDSRSLAYQLVPSFTILWRPGIRVPTSGVEVPRKTGDATTTGPNSPAVTGDGNQIQYNQPPTESQKPKKKKKE